MEPWYRLNLGNGAAAFDPTRKVQDAFMALLIAHGAPRPGWALFSRYDLQADNVELYFTPATKLLAAQFNAQPCPRPVLNEYRMSLLCGEGDGLLFHFPEHPISQR